MTFKERHVKKLEENYDGDYGNNNRNKYLTGALGGAGAVAASHVLPDNKMGESWLDTAKSYHQNNDLWGNTLQKGQDALEWMKTGGAETDTSSVADKVESIVDNL